MFITEISVIPFMHLSSNWPGRRFFMTKMSVRVRQGAYAHLCHVRTVVEGVTEWDSGRL